MIYKQKKSNPNQWNALPLELYILTCKDLRFLIVL
jgi:hypothetical protein